MSEGRPTVSVVLPVYNGERFLREAIESVLPQLSAQDELIAIDDGSTDGSGEICRATPLLRYIRQENAGPAAARNAGIRAARGEIVAFIDADDVWPRGKLVEQAGVLAADPGVYIVIGRTEYRALGEAGERSLGAVTFFHLGSAIFRRSVFDRIGLLDESRRSCEDVELFLRARESGLSIVSLESIGLIYRKHPGGMSFGKGIHESNFLVEIKKSLDRRRSGPEERARALPRLKEE